MLCLDFDRLTQNTAFFGGEKTRHAQLVKIAIAGRHQHGNVLTDHFFRLVAIEGDRGLVIVFDNAMVVDSNAAVDGVIQQGLQPQTFMAGGSFQFLTLTVSLFEFNSMLADLLRQAAGVMLFQQQTDDGQQDETDKSQTH